MTILYNKNFLPAIALAILLIAAFWLSADFAVAQAPQPPTATSNSGSAITTLTGALVGLPALGIVAVFVLLLDFVAVWILGWASTLLNYALLWNLTTSPADIPVVLVGWTIFRDMANGLFILVILWIALTIVLNIESLGG